MSQSKMKKLIVLTLGLLMTAPAAQAGPRHEELLPDLDFTQAYPDRSRLQQAYIPAHPNGNYQLRMVGDKFAAVFTNDGAPIAIFDLSLNTLSLPEVVMGGFGLGDLNVRKLVQLIKRIGKARKDGNTRDGESHSEVMANLTGKAREKALQQGADFFKDIRLTDAWAARNGIARVAGDREAGVTAPVGASFSLADLEIKTERGRSAFAKILLKLARALYPQDGWTEGNVLEFAREMEFRYVDARPGYDLVWNKSIRAQAKPARLPGVAVNYLYPWQNLGYKYTYAQIDQQSQGFDRSFGPVGILIEMFFSRVCHGLIERIDYHERQLIGLLEAQERFEYNADLPKPLVDVTLDLLYLSALTGHNASLMDGPGKRVSIRTKQELSREKVLKRLAKSDPAISYTEFGDGKYAVARKNGEFQGIISTAIGPHKLFRYMSRHASQRGPFFKVVERNVTEITAFVARALLPSSFGLKLGSIRVAITVEPMMYEMAIRGRMVSERVMEGELSGLIDEALAGRLALPLSADELRHVQKYLRATVINPYELTLSEEKAVVAKNLALIKQIIAGNNPGQHFRYETLIPMVD